MCNFTSWSVRNVMVSVSRSMTAPKERRSSFDIKNGVLAPDPGNTATWNTAVP